MLIPVPFTDLSSQKRRPVIIISRTAYHQKTTDMVVVAMTSNPAAADYSFVIDSPALERGHLNHRGTLRVDRIDALAQALIVKRFGKVNSAVLAHICDLLKELVEGQPRPGRV